MTLTYAELDALTDLMADNLRAKGVKVDSAAAIFMERSAHYVMSYIAILKAGKGYLYGKISLLRHELHRYPQSW